MLTLKLHEDKQSAVPSSSEVQGDAKACEYHPVSLHGQLIASFSYRTGHDWCVTILKTADAVFIDKYTWWQQ